MFDRTHRTDSQTGQKISPVAPLLTAAIPRQLIFPLRQRGGVMLKPVVSVGDQVLKGTLIADSGGSTAAPCHASSSGMVRALQPWPVATAPATESDCLIIETDGRDQPLTTHSVSSPNHDSTGDWLERIQAAGIVGLGGGGFPAALKLNADRPLDTIIINGMECEPYVSCDAALMVHQPEKVVAGTEMVRTQLQARQAIIAIEAGATIVQTALQHAIDQLMTDRMTIAALPGGYPSGSEKQLIHQLTGRQLPIGQHPAEIGVICHNVATIAALFDALTTHAPMISRIVTVAGDGVAQPGNLVVRIGTPISELITQCGGYRNNPTRMIVGGPMMGTAITDDAIAITKTSIAILVGGANYFGTPPEAMPCIRCGQCAAVCPSNLLPQTLYDFCRTGQLEHARASHLMACIECGCCDQVCPSHIPLVKTYLESKKELRAEEQHQAQAKRAEQRFTARTTRLAHQKKQKARRLSEKKAAIMKRKTSIRR